MFSAKNLSQQQVDTLKNLAAAGATLSDLQRHLKQEEDISLTYMDMRFAVLDLGIDIVDEKKSEDVTAEIVEQNIQTEKSTGTVNVALDNIALPGAMVSGKVTFSDGETAIWMIDSSGRPGLDPDTPGYRPSQEDVLEFQTQLKSLLSEHQSGL